MSRIGEKVKQLRIQKGMTAKQLGKKLGVAESFVNDVESGRKVLNSDLINRLSKVLGKDINDVSMSFEEETFKEETVEKKVYTPISTKIQNKKEEVSDIWNSAFGSVLKNVPIYDYSLTKIMGSKMLPIKENKIEGYGYDKVFYIKVQDEDMIGFRINEGDIAFAHICNEIHNSGIYFVEVNDKRYIRQIKKLDNTKLLLISNKGAIKTETIEIKQVKVLGKLDKLEIEL